MPKKSVLIVTIVILSMFFFSSCSREKRTFDYASDLQYDFVFVVNVGGQNEFEGDCCYNFMGGPVSEISLAFAYEPDVIRWRVVTQGFDGIVTPYAHDKLRYPPYLYLYTDANTIGVYGDNPNSDAIVGIIRTHSLDRRLVPNAKYRATAKRVNGEISHREFDYVR